MNKNKDQNKMDNIAPTQVDSASLSRRKFLTRGSVVLASAGVLTLGVGGALVTPSAWAASAVGDHASESLLRMARDIYPHDTLEDKYYTQVLLPMGESAATDKELATLLTEGVSELDRRTKARFGKGYLKVEQETDRVEILREMETSAFFQKIKGAVMMGIYNNPELWPWFGFGGSAWEKGGYIDRGFDKNDWI
ncbi:MAG: transcriptional initiation protein Tat [Halopseudomonas sp.]